MKMIKLKAHLLRKQQYFCENAAIPAFACKQSEINILFTQEAN